MKYLIFLIISLIIVNFSTPDLYAQQTPNTPQTGTSHTKSSKVCVKVGEPTTPIPPECVQSNTQPTGGGATQPGDSEGLARILEWDEIIVSGLETGVWDYFNRMMTNHTNGEYSTGTWPGTSEANLYWCTYSIIDSYRLAGIPGLGKNLGHAAVVGMRSYWRSLEAQGYGYVYVDYEGNNQNIVSVQPGFAMFMESVAGTHTGREHVNMVKEISLDSNGNGYLVTNDSNSSSKSHKYTVAGWRVLNTVYPVRGFGGI